jgi:hypothetical protein
MTPNEIIGSLVYRTNEALNKNAGFLEAIKGYYYYPAVVHDGRLHLWHFPGTGQEISQVFQTLSGHSMTGSKLKFPGLLNYQAVIQDHGASATVMRYNLAIVAPVLSEWTTQQREEQVYKRVLKPVEDEFINQIELFPHIQTPTGRFPYVSAYIPTTGSALNSIMKIQYGDFIDAVELPSLSIKVLETCRSMSKKITEESEKVTDEIKNLTK